ncbi:MAG: DUF1778 domain-containing protein [Verrucomicrobia bacterium]|nr:DUF1778 domain-containing protein [Verrucomicrobiota bacterium]MDA7510961.1 DUF1778 domain-containing protein [Verrucomicrobiota bacterium]
MGTSQALREQILVRLDKTSKDCLTKAAELRRISVSDYVRQITVTQAKREVEEAGNNTISLTADEQRAFWTALSETPRLTQSQKALGAIIRGN